MEFAAIQKQKSMTPEQKMMFQSQYQNERKNPSTSLILAFFGLHYFYLGKIGLGIVFWLTGGGFGIWWLIDLFRAKGMAEAFNLSKAEEIAAFVTV